MFITTSKDTPVYWSLVGAKMRSVAKVQLARQFTAIARTKTLIRVGKVFEAKRLVIGIDKIIQIYWPYLLPSDRVKYFRLRSRLLTLASQLS